MLTPISYFTLKIVTETALGLSEQQAQELRRNVSLRLITRNEAVEIPEVKATFNQIIRCFGTQRAEQIMAEHLNTEVPA